MKKVLYNVFVMQLSFILLPISAIMGTCAFFFILYGKIVTKADLKIKEEDLWFINKSFEKIINIFLKPLLEYFDN